ncbi:MAG TPA: cytochrome c maturation protein CcmE [Ferruginibacter sp.]|nr:cytochrome c maturation protein CcmE [Ferruginibacter sp.]
MKKTHIIILVAIAALIVTLIIFSASDFSTYDTINSAKAKPGKYVHLIAKVDKSQPIEYDPLNNPNYLSFYAIDSLGGKTRVIYRNSKPTDLEKSERVVMKGKMQADHFECDNILLKCPSKYKDDKEQLQKTITDQSAPSGAGPTDSAYSKQ